jgi:hypothetical protein
MPDETTTATTEAQPAAAATGETHAAAGAGAAGHDDKEPDKLPHLAEGSADEKWVKYLNQMLNYYYQMQVVPEDGHYDSQTANVVSHYRGLVGLPAGTHVDKEMWLKLGVEDSHAAWEERQRTKAKSAQRGAAAQHGAGQHGGDHGSFEPQHYAVNLIPLTSAGSCWAASMAMVLNFKGGSHTVASVCEHGHIDPNDFKSAGEVVSIGTEMGLQQVYCDGTSAAGWAEALHTGPLWTPIPGNDSNVIVVAGINGSGDDVTVHVLDPAQNYDDWMGFSDFSQHYSFGDSLQLLG